MTQEQKEKSVFFAQYLWQKVFSHPEYATPVTLRPARMVLVGGIDDEGYCLQLRPISDLTDEELVECACINWPLYRGKTVNVEWVKHIIGTISMRHDIAMYLISRSICLDESAVAKGWVVLKPLNQN